MSSEILAKLFASNNRVKLLRLFLFNPETNYNLKELLTKSKISSSRLRQEISLLESAGIIKARKIPSPTPAKTKKSKKKKKAPARESAKNKTWSLNQDFFFIDHLKALFNADFFANQDELVHKFKNCGKIKLLVLSGMFIQEGGERADILIVGDDLKRKLVEKAIGNVETEIGRELIYCLMDTRDYIYRIHSSDKFLRDILDYPHKKIIDKMTS